MTTWRSSSSSSSLTAAAAATSTVPHVHARTSRLTTATGNERSAATRVEAVKCYHEHYWVEEETACMRMTLCDCVTSRRPYNPNVVTVSQVFGTTWKYPLRVTRLVRISVWWTVKDISVYDWKARVFMSLKNKKQYNLIINDKWNLNTICQGSNNSYYIFLWFNKYYLMENICKNMFWNSI